MHASNRLQGEGGGGGGEMFSSTLMISQLTLPTTIKKVLPTVHYLIIFLILIICDNI